VKNSVEETTKLKLDFNKILKIAKNNVAVIPVAVQDASTREVILIAYTNKKAFKKAMSSRMLVLWSTSRNQLWEKGKTSGSTFEIVEARVNCEQNALVYIVRPYPSVQSRAKKNTYGICHTVNKKGKYRNCFYRKINFNTLDLINLDP
jgi:phosphoribosyl-AMP cyclohydrolase